MSIPNLIHKIKSKTSIDKSTIMYLFIIIGVGISSFSLGRLSANSNSIEDKNDTVNIVESGKLSDDKNVKYNNNVLIKQQIQSTEKRYVASKNGKIYYGIDCSGVKRIKPENEVWFSTQSDAEKSGYKLSSTCK